MTDLNYNHLRIKTDLGYEVPEIRISAARTDPVGDYFCELTFNGFGHDFTKKVIGISELQAFVLAIKLANTLIMNSDEFSSGAVFCTISDGSIVPLILNMIGGISMEE